MLYVDRSIHVAVEVRIINIDTFRFCVSYAKCEITSRMASSNATG